MKAKGFTLIELLTTTTIIGLLAVVGTVSYSFVRAKARDTKRVADIRTIQNAIETYFEQNGKYPSAPNEGLVLGADNAKMISDAGITPFGGESGILYLQNVPPNVLPNGVPYIYHSKNRNGSLCAETCPAYEVTFKLETPTGELTAGPHLLTDEGTQGTESGMSGVSAFTEFASSYLPSAEDLAGALGSVQETAALARQTADRPEIQTVNAVVVAPVSFLGALASLTAALASAVPIANAGPIALFLFTQPFLIFSRRKRQSWSVVYNAATKVPIDLAAVRLVEAETGRPIAVKVTDKDGRFAFTPKAGTYRLEIAKPGFIFPAASLASMSDDGKFVDVYHGTLITVARDGETLTVNVPMDPSGEADAEVRQLLSVRNKKQLRKTAALAGPTLGALALIVTPGVPMLLLFLLHLFLYLLFKRLAEPPAPKGQGMVYDIDTKRPIAGAVIRILSLPYQKVLETRLTDAQGRYSFQVGNGTYALTVAKPGYEKTETDPIDFTAIDKPAWIASDLPMRRTRAGLDS